MNITPPWDQAPKGTTHAGWDGTGRSAPKWCWYKIENEHSYLFWYAGSTFTAWSYNAGIPCHHPLHKKPDEVTMEHEMIYDTKELQLVALRRFLKEIGYRIVYTDNTVNVQQTDEYYALGLLSQTVRTLAFNTAVKMYNLGNVLNRSYGKKHGGNIEKLYLQQSKGEVVCIKHQIKFYDKDKGYEDILRSCRPLEFYEY